MADGVQKPVLYRVGFRFGAYEVRELCGREGISQLFRFELRLRSSQYVELLDPERLCGDIALIELQREGELLRRIRGIVTHASHEAVIGGEPEIVVVVEPALVRARFRTNMRVFRNRTVVQIIEEVLADAGLEVELRLGASYAERPYCVQFRESDLAFISRLMEEEGICYFFKHDDQGTFEQEVPTLVLCDEAERYERMAGDDLVPFVPAKGMGRADETVFELGRRSRMQPRQVILRDFNTDRPSLSLEVSAEGASPTGQDHYDYPGKYQLPAEGERLARIRSESMRCAAFQCVGASDCSRFAPGHVFTLQGAPDAIGDGDYVLTRVEHDWERVERPYSNEFEAMPGAVAFRPEQRTPRPVVENPLTGYVTGPPGSEIHPDEMGRVKVHFPWDRLQRKDDACSHWVPVVQDNTGESVAIPRVGWEVLVGFLEGDPDRPVVLGRVYNGADLPPEKLPDGKTRSTFKSYSSPLPVSGGSGSTGLPEGVGLGPGGGDPSMTSAANEILMEDAAGAELIRIQAQRDQDVVVANDKTENVLNKETNAIDGNEDVSIGVDHDAVVGEHRSLTIQGDQILSVLGNRLRKVDFNDTIDVLGLRTTIIGGMHIRRVATYDDTNVDALIECVGGCDVELSLKPNTINAGQFQSLTVGGLIFEGTLDTKEETAQTHRTELVGGALKVHTNATFDLGAAATRTTTVGANMDVEATGKIILEGSSSVDMSCTTGLFQGADSVVLQVGGTEVSIGKGEVSIKAATVTIKGTTYVGSAEVQFNP
ncbi:MAG: type VI secretion system tip protein VgrG [Deltaproteobacteria bacterium]|jgi:type VI secretion system secreted protein VgrG|nr:type VI secretion system tip protein VgrG [Deltaproteobacteria bacterium]MBW2533388.1 type VI secretion system tip protein VgrG [Deltaproteobacteria bacterium]